MKEQDIVNTQIRIPAGLHEYIKKKSAEMGMPQNAVMLMLMWDGKRAMEAELTIIRRQDLPGNPVPASP